MKNLDPNVIVMTRQAFEELYAKATANPFGKSEEHVKGINKHVRKKNPLFGAEWRQNLKTQRTFESHQKKQAARVAGQLAGKTAYLKVNSERCIPVRVMAPSKNKKGFIRVMHFLNIEMEVFYEDLAAEPFEGLLVDDYTAVQDRIAYILGAGRKSNRTGTCPGINDSNGENAN